MKSAFEIISKGFSRHVFSKLSSDPYLDAVEALNKYHKLSSYQMVSEIEPVFGRLKGWAIFRESGSTLATDLADYPSLDDRKVSEAFVGELLNLNEPAVFVVFTGADFTPEALRATYSERCVVICHPDGINIVDVTDPTNAHCLTQAYQSLVRHAA
ncbi:hypothetical protein CLV88_1281 [Shimia abyssi]|uniref:Uncharacterized protein n=2 Tax=Shimia abyssi TaxID=1662395 RepID=A0A2P8EYI0_9RHOB|nr:hypothetical protein CLV88_1281 [Shimia abyssi]